MPSIPPNLKNGYQILSQEIFPTVSGYRGNIQQGFEEIENYVITPAVTGIVGLPQTVEDLTAGVVSAERVSSLIGFDGAQNETFLTEGTNIAQSVTLTPGSNEPALRRRTMWDLLATEGDLFSGNSRVENGLSLPIFAPFSIYFPSSMWPYSDEDGSRYTVHDLGEEPIESNFLGTKPLMEILLQRRLNKVGAIPGFPLWGDFVLGIPATAVVVGAGLLLGFTAQVWGPPIITATSEMAARAGLGAVKIVDTVQNSIANSVPSER